MLSHGHVYAEAGAVVGLAALLAKRVPLLPERPTVIVVTGANMDLAQLRELI